MKKILLPTDFSDTAGYALRCAANLAKTYKAEIIALYMIDRADAFLTRKEAMDLFENIDYHERINDSFKEFLNHEYLKGIKVTTEIKRQIDFSKISDIANELDIDLIVMGSHGAHGLEGMVIGSNAEKVIRTSNVPVLIIKNFIPDFKFRKVVMACDLNLDLIETFKKATDFLDKHSIDYKIVYVNTPEDFLSTRVMQAEVSKYCEAQGLDEASLKEKVVFYDDFNVEAGIFNFAAEVNADSIVILTHGRKGLARLVFQNYGEKIANHSDFPILTVKA